MQKQIWLFGARKTFHKSFKAKYQRAIRLHSCVSTFRIFPPFMLIVRAQEGGVNLLAQLWDCAADDLSHYDVTSEPVREISMAAKR